MGASKVVKQNQNLPAETCKADKFAFSKARPVDDLLVAKNDLDEDAINVDSVQVSPMQPKQCAKSPELFTSRRLSQDRVSAKQGTCLESNIVVILTIVFAIVIKLLELFEGIVTSIVNVINRPPSFQNKGVCFYSGAGSPSFSVSSVENKSPVYFCGDSKEENPRNFKFVMAEGDKAVLEKVDTNVVDTLDFDDVVITDIRSSDVFFIFYFIFIYLFISPEKFTS